MRIPSLSRPEHTGENRCWPCTVLNVALLAAVGLLVGRRRRAPAALIAALGAAAIYARGYVLPYTPRFAPRIAAALGLEGRPGSRAEGGGSLGGAEESDASADGEALFEMLLAAGAVEADGEAVTLAPEVEERWTAAMADLRAGDDEALARAALEASPAADAWTVTDDSWTTPVERNYVVLSDGSETVTGETWLPRPVAIAEVAAVEALEPLVEGVDSRRAAARAMRVFLETCPACGAPVEETTTAACCGVTTGSSTRPDEVLACPDCDVRLHTFD